MTEIYKRLELTRAKFLLFSWRDIDFDFTMLTPNEKDHGDEETFGRLLCFSWDVVQKDEPTWFAAYGFGQRHIDAVNYHSQSLGYAVVAVPFG